MSKQRDHTWTALDLARQAVSTELKVFRSLNKESRGREGLLRALLRFLNELFALPGGRSELMSRGLIIPQAAAPKSDYFYAGADALYWATKVRGRQKAFDAYIERLQKTPLRELGMREAEKLIGQARRLLPTELHHDADQSFVRWEEACRQIRIQADEKGADGCHYLLRVAAARESGGVYHDPEVSEGGFSISEETPPVWLRLWRDEIDNACLSLVDWAKAHFGDEPVPTSPAKALPSKNVSKGDARKKLVGALNKHHGYSNGSCDSFEPIGVRKLAKMAKTSPGSAWALFQDHFEGGHPYYLLVCRDPARLTRRMRVINGDIPAERVHYGRSPDGPPERDDE